MIMKIITILKSNYFISILAILVACVFSVGVMADTKITSIGKDPAMSVSFFVQGNGSIIKDKKTGQYQLILQVKGAKVIWFSDRPVRKAGHMTLKKFIEVWNKGKNSFDKDPPNALVIIASDKPVVVKLTLLDYKNASVTFGMTRVSGILDVANHSKLLMYIDFLERSKGYPRLF